MFEFLKRSGSHPDHQTGQTQKQQLLNHFKSGESITQIVATKRYGITRLAPRIAELKKRGHNIRTEYVRVGTARIAIYSLETTP